MVDPNALGYAAVLGKRGGGSAAGGRPKKKKVDEPVAGELMAGDPDDPILADDLPTQVVDSGRRMLSNPVINNAAELYAHARAQKEAAQAATQELAYKRKAGMLVPRDDVRRASATAFSAIAQSLRSIPDLLERQVGLDPMLAERVGIIIDNHLAELSEELRRMHENVYVEEEEV